MWIDLPSNVLEEIRDMLQKFSCMLDNIEVRKNSGMTLEDTVRLWIYAGGYSRFLTRRITEFNKKLTDRPSSDAIKSV